jgi:very-short-patch-repair endonuclease
MKSSAIARRLETKRWRVVYPSVYFVGGGSIDWKARLAAACTWAGPNAAVSHLAAAQLHGLLTSTGKICITVAERKTSAHGIEVHLSPRGAGQIVAMDRIPVTSVDRTILDVCRNSGRAFSLSIVERAIRQGRTDLRRLARTLEDDGATCRTLRWILEKRFALGVTDSDAEDLYLKLARKDAVCRAPIHHHVVTRHGHRFAELDFSYLPELVNVEIGREGHDDPVASQRDKRRDALLGEMGWVVLRFTYWQLVREPEWVIARVRTTLELRKEGRNHG